MDLWKIQCRRKLNKKNSSLWVARKFSINFAARGLCEKMKKALTAFMKHKRVASAVYCALVVAEDSKSKFCCKIDYHENKNFGSFSAFPILWLIGIKSFCKNQSHVRCQIANCAWISTVVFVDFVPENLLTISTAHEIWAYRVLVHTCRNSIECDWKTFATWRNLFGDWSENVETFSSILNRAVAFSVDYRTKTS